MAAPDCSTDGASSPQRSSLPYSDGGMGFYGPPVYLHAVHEARGWSLALVSMAVTVHFLFGAVVIANLPKLYRRFGVPTITKTGSILLALGVIGWAVAHEPWQLFAATLLSGAGWVTMGAAALNAIISPWFVRERPAALASAYNGASVGGVVFSPVWVGVIGVLGFPLAAVVMGLVMVATIWTLAEVFFAKSPGDLSLTPDGDAPGAIAISVTSALARASRQTAIPGFPVRHPSCWNGARLVRTNRSVGTFVLAAGAGARGATRWRCCRLRDGCGHCRAHSGRLADAGRRRSASRRVPELCRPDCRFARFVAGSRR